jgi:hypothetical protein
MADDEKPPPPPPPGQQPVWLPEPMWEPSPQMRRNPNLYFSQDSFVPPPMQPPGGTPAGAQVDEIAARFRDVERVSAELTSKVAELRGALQAQTGRVVGPGHNQGPPISPEELDDVEHLIALLKEKGSTPAPADRALITEQAEKTVWLSDRIKTWLGALAITVVTIDGREVIKDLTASLCQAVADKIVELYHVVIAWLSSFPSI